LSGPLRAGQVEHLLAQFQVDVHHRAAEFLRYELQGGSLARGRRTRQDNEPEILARRLFDGLFKLRRYFSHDFAGPTFF